MGDNLHWHLAPVSIPTHRLRPRLTLLLLLLLLGDRWRQSNSSSYHEHSACLFRNQLIRMHAKPKSTTWPLITTPHGHISATGTSSQQYFCTLTRSRARAGRRCSSTEGTDTLKTVRRQLTKWITFVHLSDHVCKSFCCQLLQLNNWRTQ